MTINLNLFPPPKGIQQKRNADKKYNIGGTPPIDRNTYYGGGGTGGMNNPWPLVTEGDGSHDNGVFTQPAFST